MLDEQSFVRLHIRRIIPLMPPRIGFHFPRPRARPSDEAVARLGARQGCRKVGVECDEVVLVDRSGIADGKIVSGHIV